MKQRCVCETCGTVFLDMDAYEYVKLHHVAEPITESIFNIPDLQNRDLGLEIEKRIRKFDKWYVTALRHWIDNPTHDIIVSCGSQRMNIVETHKQLLSIHGDRYLAMERYLMEKAWEETFPI